MKSLNNFGSALGVAAVLALGACADMNSPLTPTSVYSGYGVVQSVELVKVERSGIGAGAVAGAVVGGVVGSQIGSGSGSTAATVLGAAGGAYAGHELEKRARPQTDAYRLTIRMSDGSYQSVTQTSAADIRVGDRVRIDNGIVVRY